ncbi:hypothetical protein [Desulfosporosinus nitroreducens]|uniref:Uncharacterized protein n=1 Tax=Desulfosporosinus nitroreducens TaxID=2018668 RepID=A0ABT8QWI2_9FIRM|nr:hypothetical protein [Desulfosporosinus nitroreducens]MDO0824869.1 hypothetical protein [Desulfosporosinus nitroreducens]
MSTSVLANPNTVNTGSKSIVITENKQITDIDKLFDRAKKGISDIKDNDIVPQAKGEAISKESGISIKAHLLSTTQLLKEEQLPGGDIVKTYATTNFALVPESQLLDAAQGIASDSSLTDSDWDKTDGVKAYGTIYWNYSYNGGVKYASMAGQTNKGGWSPLSGYSLSKKKVTYGQSGMTASNGAKTQSSSITPSALTWSYKVPSKWIPVKADSTSYMGQSAYALVSRGSSSWGFWFYNRQYAGGM